MNFIQLLKYLPKDFQIQFSKVVQIAQVFSLLKKSNVESHRIKNLFIDNYDYLIFEDSKQLIDMVYLSKTL